MTYMKPRKTPLSSATGLPENALVQPISPGCAMTVSRDRAYLMDVLRGLLASWVVLHHIVLASGFDPNVYPWRLLAHHGQEPVLVFFILSGFAITKSLYTRPQHWSSFLIARFWRIYPVYFVTLAIGAGALWYAEARGGTLFVDLSHLRLASLPPEQASPPWLHMLLHLFQLHGLVPGLWLPHADTSLVAPAWSLSTEFQFYTIAPVLCLVLLQTRGGNRAALALLMVIAVILPNLIDDPSISNANILRYADLFVLGMLGAIAHNSRRLGKLGYCLSAIVVAAASLQAGRVIVTTAVLVWLLFWWASTTAPVERLLDTWLGRLGLFLGALSFPLYLIHYPLAWLLLIAMTDWLPADRLVVLAVWVPVTLALSYIGASLLHRYAEVPATRLGKRISERREVSYDNRNPATIRVAA